MKKINLGCGDKYTDGWINLDFNSSNKNVISHNLLTSLPFNDGEVDVIYNSHFLEHFSLADAKRILSECYRILGNKGVIRIVVPDLENVCREYLYLLDHIDSDNNDQKYEWLIIELLDQFIRNNHGGMMKQYCKSTLESKDEFMINYIHERTGETLVVSQNNNNNKKKLLETLEKISIAKFQRKLVDLYISFVKRLLPAYYREYMIDNTVPGEKHKWMYDKYSLQLLLKEIGFSDIKFLDFKTSYIPNFTQDYLDINLDQKPYRQSSIYCEAFK